MADSLASIDGDVYRTPSPATVARLIETHGFEAATTRWHWLGARTLSSLAQAGRAAAGQISTVQRKRYYDDQAAAVCVESAYVLGSLSRGERAAGISKVRGRGICAARGLTPPSISPEERALASRIGRAANAGDTAAIAARDAQHALEHSVGAVIRAALALVADQPVTGRYCLPPVDEALRAALAGLPDAAIWAVFPELATPAQETAPAPHVAEPVPGRASAGRLGLEDLGLAGSLVRTKGLRPAQAVALVRADVAACAAASDHAVAAWYDAIVECGLGETEVAKAAAEARYASACELFGIAQ